MRSYLESERLEERQEATYEANIKTEKYKIEVWVLEIFKHFL